MPIPAQTGSSKDKMIKELSPLSPGVKTRLRKTHRMFLHRITCWGKRETIIQEDAVRPL